MELSKSGARVEQHAEAVADAVTPSTWSTGAVKDAADAIDMLAEALAAFDPEAARTW
ncbi:hypothetical protein ACFYNL_06075 [Streptomyces sp. NPDC007808]|uniref:hypothetical protein n=1 Tax=Streptomyces sp. NPDC007808 TaxID=3364779 RepID=UPI00367728FE